MATDGPTDAIAQRRRHMRPAHQTYNKQPTLAEKIKNYLVLFADL
jgi:hypothetical protein